MRGSGQSPTSPATPSGRARRRAHRVPRTKIPQPGVKCGADDKSSGQSGAWERGCGAAAPSWRCVGGLPHHYEVVSSEVAVQVGACGMDRSPWLSYLSYYILHCSYTKYSYTSIILVSSENKIRLILNACVYIVRLDASISMRVDNDLCLPIFVGIVASRLKRARARDEVTMVAPMHCHWTQQATKGRKRHQ